MQSGTLLQISGILSFEWSTPLLPGEDYQDEFIKYSERGYVTEGFLAEGCISLAIDFGGGENKKWWGKILALKFFQ